MVIRESWTAYSMWATMISALITFIIQKQRLLLKRWAHSMKMVLCYSDDADATFQELFIGAHRLIIECYVPIGMHI